jgi:hypothetical protein
VFELFLLLGILLHNDIRKESDYLALAVDHSTFFMMANHFSGRWTARLDDRHAKIACLPCFYG